MRYTAHTIDGLKILASDSLRGITNALIDHARSEREPHIAYMYDNLPGNMFPYTTWCDDWRYYIGTQHRTFEDAVNAVKEAQA